MLRSKMIINDNAISKNDMMIKKLCSHPILNSLVKKYAFVRLDKLTEAYSRLFSLRYP
jgi:hypothetical protein